MPNIQLRVGQTDTVTFVGKDQNGNPYSAFAVTRPPVISDSTALSYGQPQGNDTIFPNPAAVGKTNVTVTWTFTDNNNSITVTTVDTYDVLAPEAHLASVETVHNIQ